MLFRSERSKSNIAGLNAIRRTEKEISLINIQRTIIRKKKISSIAELRKTSIGVMSFMVEVRLNGVKV